MRTLLPEGWPRPNGYANGVAAGGAFVFVAGQIGWTPAGVFEAKTMPAQFRQTLDNTLAVLACAGAGPEHVVRMTWYITDKRAYLDSLAEIGAIWREKMGRRYPAMAVVVVSALIEDQALIEIETTAVAP
jgi:enamine deaminase RidA (YjgF/YER057c/UK114 family)